MIIPGLFEPPVRTWKATIPENATPDWRLCRTVIFRKDMITQPKTPKSIRVITMPDFLAEEFREYCSHLYGIMKKERLFRFTKSHMEHCMAILVVYNMLLTRFKEM